MQTKGNRSRKGMNICTSQWNLQQEIREHFPTTQHLQGRLTPLTGRMGGGGGGGGGRGREGRVLFTTHGDIE